MIPNSKIEDRALGALQNIINEHPTMTYSFNRIDKNMCWDGYIEIYNSYEKQDKQTFEDRVPIQIKGHIDRGQKYLKKQHIKYSVSKGDLNIYFRTRGVLYFLIFMSESGEDISIFYTSLFGSKLKTYQETINKKGNKNSLSIVFTRLPNDPEELYSIVKQFSTESNLQGSGEGQIVPKTVPFNSLDKNSDITFFPLGVSNENEFFNRLFAGDICFYTTSEGGMKIPIEWTDRFEVNRIQKENKPVSIGKRIFYDKYCLEKNSIDDEILILSDNLKINLGDGTIELQLQTSFDQLRIDAEFLLETQKNNNPIMVGSNLLYSNGKLDSNLNALLYLIIDIDNTLKMIKFNFIPPSGGITKDILDQLCSLVDIKNGKANDKIIDHTSIYYWRITDKYMPIIICHNDNQKFNDLFTIYTREWNIGKFDKNKTRMHKLPLFYAVDNSVFSNLYYYDYDSIKEQIDTEDVDEYTFSELGDASLLLLNAYDVTGDLELLNLAKYQLKRIEDVAGDNPEYLINEIQIKIREGTFNANDRKIIQNIQTDNPAILFCKHVILSERNDAQKYLNSMPEEEKATVIDWPIMNLYKKL